MKVIASLVTVKNIDMGKCNNLEEFGKIYVLEQKYHISSYVPVRFLDKRLN